MLNRNSAEQGRPTILVVEDNYLTAVALCQIVQDCGFAVAGPAARLERGLDLIAYGKVDGALVDINLDGTESYPLCAALDQLRVPFALVTAYAASKIPSAFRGAPLISKPVDPQQIKIALGAFGAALASSSPAARVKAVNGILRTLDLEDQQRLSPLMETVELEVRLSLETPGTLPAHLVFPTRGVVSITVPAGGYGIEAGLVGREGVLGIAGIMDAGPSAFRATVQVRGTAVRVPVQALLPDLANHARLRHQLLVCAYDFMRQIAETTLASAKGTVEERVARWLLMMGDRLDDDEIFETHAGIAKALGVRRAGVTVALHILEGKRAIISDRKRVRIIDRHALRMVAGFFYQAPPPH